MSEQMQKYKTLYIYIYIVGYSVTTPNWFFFLSFCKQNGFFEKIIMRLINNENCNESLVH